MRVLALDCAVGMCSVGLVEDGIAVAGRSVVMTRMSEAHMPQLAQDVLRGHAMPDLVAVTTGPGSFTGIRQGLAFAHGLAIGWDRPLIGITVIEALLQMMPASGRAAWVAIRGRAGHVFLGDRTGVASYALDALPALGREPMLLGNAAVEIAALLGLEGEKCVPIDAACPGLLAIAAVGIARWSGNLPALAAQPLYLEAPAATRPGM